MSINQSNSLKLRAVVVNDDPIQRATLAELLRRADFEPLTFSVAEAALSAMDANAPPSLIVTEVDMPGIDGWQLCRLLRSTDYASFNGVPILVISAIFSGDEPERLAVDVGAEAFLPIPVDDECFIEQVRALVNGTKSHHQPRVLIVEDEKNMATLLESCFTDEGYRADTRASVKDALAACTRTAYDVAVLDYHLPDGAGDEVLDHLRAERPDCACIMITGDQGPKLALDWMKRGAAAYIAKPFESGYLIELCSRARRERSLLRTRDLLNARTRELQENEKRFRSVLQGIPSVAIQGYAADGTVLYWNQASVNLYGYSAEEAIGGNLLDLIVPPERREEVSRAIRWMSETGEGIPAAETEMIRKDGVRVPTLSSHVLIRYPGRPSELFCFDVDLSEQKRAEAERQRMTTQLEQVQKMESIGRLAGGVAHDFNNMLGVILGNAGLALEQLDPADPVVEDLQEIRKAAERSGELTRQLLSFAQKQVVKPTVLNLNEAVTSTLEMLLRLIGENIEVAWLPDHDSVTVRMDMSQIEQILVNLCSNARDAIKDTGTITIKTGTVTISEAYYTAYGSISSGDYAVLSITDTGCGMSAETQANQFEPFFTTKSEGKRSGMGLPVTYGIVAQNNGCIEVVSELGHGTTVKIYLPLHAAGELQATDVDHPASSGHKTILLVEDEAGIRRVTGRMLEARGYTVLSAATPGDALRLVEKHANEIDLLLTDVIMPEMNGRDLSVRVQSIQPEIHCLFMSGYSADVITSNGVIDEAVNFIQKPFTMNGLTAAIRKTLGSGESPARRRCERVE